jgi:hypothetical protein
MSRCEIGLKSYRAGWTKLPGMGNFAQEDEQFCAALEESRVAALSMIRGGGAVIRSRSVGITIADSRQSKEGHSNKREWVA